MLQNKKPSTPQVQETRRCNKYGVVGHTAVDCRRGAKPADAGQKREQQKQGKYREPIRCFECGERGHIAVNCPKNAYFCRSKKEEARSEPGRMRKKEPDMTRVGRIEGTLVQDILLDTSCDRTLVRKKLVPVKRMIVGEVPIRYAHGDIHMYPLAELEIEIGSSTFAVEAGVTDHLPVSVLLGKDVPELTQLLEQPKSNKVTDALVVTRAQVEGQRRENTLLEEREKLSGAQPKPVEEEFTQMEPELTQDAREESGAAEMGSHQRQRQMRWRSLLERLQALMRSCFREVTQRRSSPGGKESRQAKACREEKFTLPRFIYAGVAAVAGTR